MSIKTLLTRVLNWIGLIDDYVVEQGTTTATNITWTYRKWNSGIAECWGYTSSSTISCTSQWGNGYYSALQTVVFPSGLFTSTPRSVQITMWDNGGGYYATMKTWGINNVQYYIWSPKSESRTCDTNFYVAGTWK